jgi:hypothetical protein
MGEPNQPSFTQSEDLQSVVSLSLFVITWIDRPAHNVGY